VSLPPSDFVCCDSTLGYQLEAAFSSTFDWRSSTVDFWVALGESLLFSSMF
jgi:hypothetical protein